MSTAAAATLNPNAAFDHLSAEEKFRFARKVSIAASIGTAIEFYDFFIYATAAALVFRSQFFPNMDPVTGTAVSIATFAAGYLSRPIGAAVIANLGDRYGRKNMLIISMMTMGVATFLIGCLPTAATIGSAAPILLILLRVIQGIGVGGEQSGGIVMATEYAPPRLRGLFAGLASCGVAAGVATGNLVFLTMRLSTSPEWFQSFGWRIPFMLSILLIGVGLYVRFNIAESPAFVALQKKSAPKPIPFLELIVNHWPKVIRVLLLTMFMSSIGYVGQVFLVAYATNQLLVEPAVLLTCAIVANIIEVPTTVFSGWLSDQYGRKWIYLPTVVVGFLFSFAVFPLVSTTSWFAIAIAVIGLRIITAFMYGPQGALFSEMFNTEVRYSGVALGFAVSTTIAAVIVSFLFAGSAGDTSLPTYFMAGCAVLTFVTGLTITDRPKRDLTDQSGA